MSSADIHRDIISRLGHWRHRLLWQRAMNLLAASVLLAGAGSLLAIPPGTGLKWLITLVVLSLVQLLFSNGWQRLTPDNFVQHLNRRFPAFEESAQLLVGDHSGFTRMQQLQRERASRVYDENLAQTHRWRPAMHYRLALGLLISGVLLNLVAEPLRSVGERLLESSSPLISALDTSPGELRIGQVSVHIEPPSYTGLAASNSDQLNLELIEGSHVYWSLGMGSAAAGFELVITDSPRLGMTMADDHKWQADTVVNRTGLYHIVQTRGEQALAVGDIYSLTVTLDKVPDIRIIEPLVSSLEIPPNGPAHFKSSALVRDDFGIESVVILASVAKGSGEAVKFRDQQLDFDSSSETPNGTLYQREWDLTALGMEPGDEVYFTVIAIDNKKPAANTGRSATTIVRWLEEDRGGLAAEGLAIDFIPEFFKSQRQIIIDTEQLIADEDSLPTQEFKDTAYAIGQAQADLKLKYGQFLGDEFGEGPGEQLSAAHDTGGGHLTEEDHPDEENGALPGEGQEIGSIREIRNTTDLLQRFGHDHGNPDIGPITRRNPVALMKRAVSEMWQAEKHLQQAEPQQALPFEYEAYKYLKLARQADRIYVKRLGFEPPPVTEERRLSGELDEIPTHRVQTYNEAGEEQGPASSQTLYRRAFLLLNTLDPAVTLSPSQNEILGHLSRELTALSQQHPGLIKQAATSEKLRRAGRLHLEDCERCTIELAHTVWNLMDEGNTLLRHPNAAWYPGDPMISGYQEYRPTADPAASATEDSRADNP